MQIKKIPLLRWLFVFLGVIFFLIGAFLGANVWRHLPTTEVADGEVVGYRSPETSGYYKYYESPKIKYLVGGEERIYSPAEVDKYGSEKYPIGMKLPIRYDTQSDWAKIDNFESLWLTPMVFVFLGLIFIVIGFASLAMMNRGRRESSWQLYQDDKDFDALDSESIKK